LACLVAGNNKKIISLFGHDAPFFRRALGGMYDLYGIVWDWVIWSFEQARKAFPNSKLLINDFNILKK
jgi:endo-1,4-beta-xylanase